MTEPVIGVAASGAAPATTAAAARARAGLELDLGMGGGDGLEQKIEHVVLDEDRGGGFLRSANFGVGGDRVEGAAVVVCGSEAQNLAFVCGRELAMWMRMRKRSSCLKGRGNVPS